MSMHRALWDLEKLIYHHHGIIPEFHETYRKIERGADVTTPIDYQWFEWEHNGFLHRVLLDLIKETAGYYLFYAPDEPGDSPTMARIVNGNTWPATELTRMMRTYLTVAEALPLLRDPRPY